MVEVEQRPRMPRPLQRQLLFGEKNPCLYVQQMNLMNRNHLSWAIIADHYCLIVGLEHNCH